MEKILITKAYSKTQSEIKKLLYKNFKYIGKVKNKLKD